MARDVEKLAERVLKLPTPDKLRFAAALLEATNDIKTAAAVIQRALDELHLVDLLGGVGAGSTSHDAQDRPR
jgi:hypothetical protein